MVEEIVSAPRRQEHRTLRDFAILYRTNAQSRALEEALRKRGIPVPARRRRALLRPARDPRPHGVPQADRQSRRRRGVPPRRRTCRSAASATRRSTRSPCVAARGRRAAARRRALGPTCSRALRPAARAALAEFVALIDRLRASRARGAASTSCCATSSRRSSTASTCKAEGPDGRGPHRERARAHRRRRRDGGRRGRGGRPHAARSLPAEGDARRRRRRARPERRRRHADDDAQREGTRVPGRVHHGPRGRTLPARARVRRSGAARGGAPAVLRRHHARRGEAVPHARRAAACATASSCCRRPSRFLDGDSRRRCSRSA